MSISFHKNSLWSIIPFSLIALSQACGKGPGTTCEESSTFGCTTTIPDTGSTETGDSGTGTDTTTSSSSTTEQESQSGGNSEGESDSTTTDGSTTSVNTGTTSMDGSTTSMDTTGDTTEEDPFDRNNYLDAKLYNEVAGSGIEGDPYIICTGYQLASIAEGGFEALSAYYKIERSIDLSKEYYDQGQSQFMIGNANAKFTGNFDGGAEQGYWISGYKWIQEEGEPESLGFFGQVGSNVVIKNLYLKQISIKSLVPVSTVGGIVGELFEVGESGFTLQNCTVEGELYGDTVGGLIGRGWTSFSIKNSHFAGQAIGKYAAGGLVGQMASNGSTCNITNSYAGVFHKQEDTPLFVLQANNAGGLVGDISSGMSLIIDNSYANTKILKPDGDQQFEICLGGLIGNARVLVPETDSLTIRNSFSTSLIGYNPDPWKGGIIGKLEFTNFTFENNYWVNFEEHNDNQPDDINMGALGFADNQCYRYYDANNVVHNGNDECTTKEKTDFYNKDASVYQPWDFVTAWILPNSYSLLPILQWEITVLENP